MKLLAIGGPKHGEEIAYSPAGDRYIQREVHVPVMPSLKAVYTTAYDPWTVPTITYHTYRTQVIADRLVWVFVS